MPDAPNPLYTAATKTYINDLMIVRVPLLTGEGEMFFAKKLNGTELQVVFFRRVGSYDNLSKNFTGYYESINMRNFVYCKIDYKSGNKVHEFKSKPLFSKNETELTKNLSTGVNSCCSAFPEYSGSWIGALIWCLSKHLSVPFKNSLYGGWNCTSPEATNNELQPGDSGGGGIDMDKYFPIVFPPNPFQPGGHQASPPSVWDLFNFTPPGGGLQPRTGGGLQPGTGGSQSGPYDPWGPKDAVKSVELIDNHTYFDFAVAPFIWTFTGNDGSSFVDQYPSTEPEFKFDPIDNYESMYPRFTKMVKNLKSFVKDNPKVMNALQIYSRFSKQDILNHLTYGNGPTIKIEEMNGRFGFFNKANGNSTIHIRASYVRGLEKAYLQSTQEATAFMLAVTILHEYIHYGTSRNNISEGKWDFGIGFEKDAFNVIVDDDNAGSVVIKFSNYF